MRHTPDTEDVERMIARALRIVRHHEGCHDHRVQDDCTFARVFKGDATWHDGPGFYYVDDEYRDEGCCGAFATLDEAVAHAQSGQYCVIVEGATP